MRDLARSFAREGWQVTVITSGSKAGTERDGAVRVIRVKGAAKPGLFGYLFVWLRMFLAAMRLPATHILVTMSDPPLLAVAGRMLKNIKKNKHIHWCQDLYPDILPALDIYVPGFMMNAMMRSTRHALNDADKVITVGRCMARHLSHTGVSPKHMAVIPNWPDLALRRAGAADDANAFEPPQEYRKHEEQIKAGPRFRVLYAGNIGRAHPIDTILDTAQILQDKQPDIEFLFVGDGPRFDRLSKLRAQRHLHNIKFLPFQPAARLRALMESGDVHLISMKEDAAGMLVPSKLYGALAVGRPCILLGPAHSETAKVITDYKAGDVVAQGEAAGLAARILEYRMNGDRWFAAHKGATLAGGVFVPKASINAWMERAWGVLDTGQLDTGQMVKKTEEHESKQEDLAA